MLKRHLSFAVLALVVLVVSVLACSPPTPTATSVPQAPPPTVTPYVPATLPPEPPPEDTAPPPTESPTETLEPPTEEPTLEPVQPEATATLELTDAPTPTPTTKPTTQSTAKPTVAQTPTPTQGVSEGPLDFEEPKWVHSWERLEDGVLVTLKIVIIGGAPPFTVKHGPNVDGQTTEREYLLNFDWGCGNMAQSITVESSDGQRAKKNYWISIDQQPWCGD